MYSVIYPAVLGTLLYDCIKYVEKQWSGPIQAIQDPVFQITILFLALFSLSYVLCTEKEFSTQYRAFLFALDLIFLSVLHFGASRLLAEGGTKIQFGSLGMALFACKWLTLVWGAAAYAKTNSRLGARLAGWSIPMILLYLFAVAWAVPTQQVPHESHHMLAVALMVDCLLHLWILQPIKHETTGSSAD